MPVVHPADGPAASRPLREPSARSWSRFKDRAVQRGHGAGDDHEEVVRRSCRATSCQELSPAADDRLPLPDRVRHEPRSRGGLIRVREFVDEGLVACTWTPMTPASTRRTGRTTLRTSRIFERLASDAIAVGADVGMMGGPGPRVHGGQRRRRGRRWSCASARLRRNRRSRRRRAGPEPRRSSSRSRTSRRPTPPPSRPGRLPRCADEPDREGRVLHDRRRSVRRGDRPRRLRRQRDEARQRREGRAAGCGRRSSRRSRRGMEPQATARRSVPGTPSSSSTTWSRGPEPGRRRQPVRLARARTSTSRATTPRTTSPTSPTSARAIACPDVRGTVILRNGIEVGNIFKLGTHVTNALGAEYLGEDGERHPIVMGSYGIGLGRNVAASSRTTTTSRGSSGRPRSPRTRPPRRARGEQGTRGHGRRRAPPRLAAAAGAGPRDPVRRPRRVAGRQVRRRRPAGHALDPHRQPALARGRRRRGRGAARPA